MAVIVDIPGIGQVEAFNAASEQTLQQIAALLSGTSSAFTQASLNRLGAASSRATQAENRNTRAKDRNTAQITDETSSLAGLGNAFRNTERNANQRTLNVTGRIESMTRAIQSGPFNFIQSSFRKFGESMGKMGNSLMEKGGMAGMALGGAFTAIGGVGAMLAMLAENMRAVNENFKTAANSGAILGGSVLAFRDAANLSGLTMTQFGAVVASATKSMSVFGGGTLEGAREFARANRILVDQYGTDLLRAGLTFQDMGVATADFLANLKESGEGFNQVAISSSSIAEGTAKLAMQQKQLAAFNGTTLEQEREKQRAARKDAQLNMVLMGMDAKQRVAVQQLTQTFPQFRQFILESVAFGGPIRKESLMQQQLLGTTTGILTNTLKQVQAGSLDGSAAIKMINDLSKDNPKIRAELQNQAQIGILSIAGSQNSLVATAGQNFQTQFEIVTKSIADVGRLIQQDVEAFEKLRGNMDPLTDAITKITMDTQKAQINFSRALTNAFGTGVGSFIMQIMKIPSTILNQIAGLTFALSGGDKGAGEIDKLLGFMNQATGPGGGTPPTPPGAIQNNNTIARPRITTDPQGNVETLTPPQTTLNPNDPDYQSKLTDMLAQIQKQAMEKQQKMAEQKKQEKEQDFQNLTTMVNNATAGLGNKIVGSLEDVKKAVQHG
jgi:hypothetical protein